MPKKKLLGNWLLEMIFSGFAVDTAKKNGKSKSRSNSRGMAELAVYLQLCVHVFTSQGALYL